ncbi:MAG: J domain-containing protein [Phycisphaeraceae bacterium]|nr:MAG: J domain-containing protein [Phycisphaeraceae bacterium]
MSVKFRDYYETLDVDRSATQEEIQRAYRKLAREHHPDVNKSPEAEKRFHEIGEAYEVLKDPEKRKRYDALGENWKAGQDFRPPSGWEDVIFGGGGGRRAGAASGRGGSVRFNVEDLGGMGGMGAGSGMGGFSEFFETLFGDQFAGARAGARAGGARGGGRVSRKGETVEASVTISLEDAYHGASKSITLQTTERDESGAARRGQREYSVRIPPGTTDGAVIRLAGQGGKGIGAGAPGDLLLRVRVAPHGKFRLRDHNLETTLPIAPWEAALGAKVEAPTLEGPVTLTVPPGSQSGQKLRLRGKGLPMRTGGRGDLYVELKITVPATLTDEERKLLEELGRVSLFDPRRE